MGTGGDVKTLLEAEPLRGGYRGLFTYNIDTPVYRNDGWDVLLLNNIINMLLSHTGKNTEKP